MTESKFDISAETALVTGSSRGIGRAIAERFAEEGVDVIVSSRDQERVDEVASDINSSSASGTAVGIACDVRDWDSIEALSAAAEERFGPVDLLVNNAGASFKAPVASMSHNAWQTIVDINLTGAFNCTRVIGEGMIESGGGTIINVSSVAARDGKPGMSHYAAAKAGLNSFTRSLAVEWAPHGIQVNGIMPGLVSTPGVESQMGIAVDDIDVDAVDRQIGRPAEIARVVHFLASPAASYIQGETVVAEGVPRVGLTRHHDGFRDEA